MIQSTRFTAGNFHSTSADAADEATSTVTESEKLAPESVTLLRARGEKQKEGALYGPRGFAPFETGDDNGGPSK